MFVTISEVCSLPLINMIMMWWISKSLVSRSFQYWYCVEIKERRNSEENIKELKRSKEKRNRDGDKWTAPVLARRLRKIDKRKKDHP
jgi:hypothetical protein